MSTRLMGFAMLAVSAVCYSFSLIRSEKQKLRQLNDICALILYLKNNIEAFNTPINVILEGFDGYSSAFSEYIDSAKKYGLTYATEHTRLLVPKDVHQLLKEFSERVGSGYRDDTLRLCTYYHTRITDIYRRETEDHNKKEKMYKTLPIMSAISIGLIIM